MSKAITFKSLHRWNLSLALLHAGQGVAVLLISKSFAVAISGAYLRFNSSTQHLEPTTKTLFHIQLSWLIVAFFFLSALAHLFIGTLYRKRYERNLQHGINKARWIEYALSASLMMTAIAILVGIYDFGSLVMIFALTAIMNLMGLVMETHNQVAARTSWLSYWIGSLAGVVPWLIVAFYMWLGAHEGSKAPAFVYWIFVSIFIFFSCFALNMVLQYKKIGPWKNYLYGERVYMILSLVAKSLLAWQVFAGTLRP
ncbi:MAG TPA: heliorhodopsin HeR [Candidatus Saccharimonadales bacterium]|nr:heliorhodopsin HeR [Candidatus Saccharimonadales bacterium]